MKNHFIIFGLLFLGLLASACQSFTTNAPAGLKVLAVETFLADITQNVAGERAQVRSLIPLGLDPHAFEPTPQDVARIAQSQVLVANGAGFEEWLDKTLNNAGGQRVVIEASSGLATRTPSKDEIVDEATDPHFWLDPVSVIKYVENIRDGLTQADPAGQAVYTQNATNYITKLKELDASIQAEVQVIPIEKRLLITNHESFGYFADRYGFRILGSIIPSVSTGAAPSAQQMTQLVASIRSMQAQAIFLETGANAQLAEQLARETGVKVVSGLHTHSVTAAGGTAPSYIDMMQYNTRAIVEALK